MFGNYRSGKMTGAEKGIIFPCMRDAFMSIYGKSLMIHITAKYVIKILIIKHIERKCNA